MCLNIISELQNCRDDRIPGGGCVGRHSPLFGSGNPLFTSDPGYFVKCMGNIPTWTEVDLTQEEVRGFRRLSQRRPELLLALFRPRLPYFISQVEGR